jgi:phosphoglycolate phosphatase-like HAD superfamily hydrolase
MIQHASMPPATLPDSNTDPLPSWHDRAARKAILEFVARVTIGNSKDYVQRADRIAVFDNDGTLWAEQPYYFQGAFVIDRLKEIALRHPEWKNSPPFSAILSGGARAAAAMTDEKSLLEIIAATHAGLSTEEFAAVVANWLKSAHHPRFDRLYTELHYQPMHELLAYLRAHGFKTFIVSGGGVEFIRVFAESVYGIPPEQVVGSSVVTQFVANSGHPQLIKQPQVEFIDDGAGKPSGINRFIGRRPIIAFGNSDGDQAMLQWTAAGLGPRLVGLVHHTDEVREYAYDRQSRCGRLDQALDEALQHHWTIVDMKNDWRRVFPFTA